MAFQDIYGGSLVTSDTYTFNTTPVGSADATRKVVVTVMAEKAEDGFDTRVASATINGNAMTKVCEQQGAFGDSGAHSWAMFTAIFVYDLPSGTTADIVVSFDGDMLYCGVGVYAVYDAGDVIDFAADNGPTEVADVSVDTVDDGAVIACAVAAYTNLTPTFGWSGAAQDDSFVTFDVCPNGCASALVASGATPRTLTATCPTFGGGNSITACAISFEPA